MSSNVKISVLDLMPHRPDQRQHQTMLNTIDAARAAESFGYERFWVAEHHNAGSLLSSATVVVMAEIAAATERIRVGSGGIMLPNHAPYVVAEQFGTLNAFHPGRIDLGVGRAPGTDPMTAAALRRDDSAAMSFPAEVQQLQRFLGEPSPMHRVHAIPGQGSKVPLYILGSSLFGAQLAAQLGLPYAFASHFCPRNAAGGSGHLPRKLQALGAPGTALRHGGCNRDARRYRRASTLPVHDPAAAFPGCGARQFVFRTSRGGYGRRLDRRGEDAH